MSGSEKSKILLNIEQFSLRVKVPLHWPLGFMYYMKRCIDSLVE